MKKSLVYILPAAFLIACNGETDKADKSAAVDPKQYSIEQFYKSTNVGGGSFSSDDSKLLVSSNESGIYNVYQIEIESSNRKALTSSTKESMFGVDYIPGGNDIIYTSDKGGDENDHLFLRRADGSEKDLTPGAKEKANSMAGQGIINFFTTAQTNAIPDTLICIEWILQVGKER